MQANIHMTIHQDVMVVVELVHGNNYHSETNFHPQISGYNTVTKAIIVKFHISQITYFTLARQSCVECQWEHTSSSYDVHSSNNLWNTLHLITDDRVLVCSCTHKLTAETFNWETWNCSFKGLQVHIQILEVQVTWNMLAPAYRSH